MPEQRQEEAFRRHSQEEPSTARGGPAHTPEFTGEYTPGPDSLPNRFGRYELQRLLGKGGMGSVYLAHDPELDRLVALKIPKLEGADPESWRERFFAEARAAAGFTHPNICPVHDVGEVGGTQGVKNRYGLYITSARVGRIVQIEVKEVCWLEAEAGGEHGKPRTRVGGIYVKGALFKEFFGIGTCNGVGARCRD